MKRVCLALATTMALAGCQQNIPTPLKNGEEQANTNTGDVVFQLRDFAVDKNTTEYGGTTYTGRGTIVTQDKRLAKGDYLVFVHVNRSEDSDESTNYQVFLKDGIGTIRVIGYQTSDDAKKEKIKFTDWAIVGYTPLQPASFDQASLKQ